MGKIHHGPRHPHQDRKVPYVGESSKASYKIQKKKTPCKMTSIQTEDDVSETDIPIGHGFGYPPQIFIDHTQSTTSEGEITEERKILGRYCEFCNKCNETHCWCSSSNWEEGLTDVNDTSSKPSIEKNPSPRVRKPPVGWSTFRCRVIREVELARPHHHQKALIWIVASTCNRQL